MADALQSGVLRAGQELLWTAASLGNMSDVQGLVSMKCALDTPNPHEGNSSPLMIAAEKGHMEVVQFLMRSGSNPHFVSDSGETALHRAAAHAHLQVAKYLVANSGGGLVKIKDKAGRDAQTAAQAGGATLVSRFLTKYARDPKSCKLAVDSNLQLARLAREREARQGRPRRQQPPLPSSGAGRGRGRGQNQGRGQGRGSQRKRGVHTLRDLASSSGSETLSDAELRSSSESDDGSDESVSVGESGGLDDEDMDDMGLDVPDSPTRDRSFMLTRINESLVPEPVRAAARSAYLASYAQWRAGEATRPIKLEMAITLGRAAIDDDEPIPPPSAGRKGSRPSIYREDGSLGDAASKSATVPSPGGSYSAKHDAAWASLGRETTLDAAARIEFLKNCVAKEKDSRLALRKQLRSLRQQLAKAEKEISKSQKEAGVCRFRTSKSRRWSLCSTTANVIIEFRDKSMSSMQLELQNLTSNMMFRKVRDLSSQSLSADVRSVPILRMA